MKLSNHVIERFSHRCEEIQKVMQSMILTMIKDVVGEVYYDSKHGWRRALPVKEGVFITNKKRTCVITFIAKEKISQQELRQIYQRR